MEAKNNYNNNNKNVVTKMFMFISIITMFILSGVYGVEITETPDDETQITNGEEEGIINPEAVVGFTLLGLLIGGVFGLFFWVLWKIFKKVTENTRKSNDLVYNKFKTELELCDINRDIPYKYRNPKLFFLFYKRAKLFLETSYGRRFIAYYDGEAYKKEGFYLIGLYEKVGLFSYKRYIIIIPYHLKDIVKKNDYGKNKEIVIKAESLDEFGGSDYYIMPIIKNPIDDPNKPMLDFADYIQKNFVQNYIYREVIKDNIMEFKQSVDKAVEMNPNIPYDKKSMKK